MTAREGRRIRARIEGRQIHLLEDGARAPDGVVAITIEPVEQDTDAVLRALDQSAGAWTDENHPELMTADDVVGHVRGLRSA